MCHPPEVARPGWNPARRNRNIGTAKSGHGRDNRLVIPSRWSEDRVFWEKLRDPVAVEHSIRGRHFVVLVEPVTKGYTHCCTPDDVLRLLEMVPSKDLDTLRLFVLRQPTRKQAITASVWGRLAYFADLGSLTGAAVYLEAQELDRRWRPGTSMSVEDQREYERLVADGHLVGRPPAEQVLAACRTTQLYRTLLHEIGHQVDYLRSVERQREGLKGSEPLWDEIAEMYWRKSHREKEAFAHRYAKEVGDEMRRLGLVPFDRCLDPDRLRSQGLDPRWFDPTLT